MSCFENANKIDENRTPKAYKRIASCCYYSMPINTALTVPQFSSWITSCDPETACAAVFWYTGYSSDSI